MDVEPSPDNGYCCVHAMSDTCDERLDRAQAGNLPTPACMFASHGIVLLAALRRLTALNRAAKAAALLP